MKKIVQFGKNDRYFHLIIKVNVSFKYYAYFNPFHLYSVQEFRRTRYDSISFLPLVEFNLIYIFLKCIPVLFCFSNNCHDSLLYVFADLIAFLINFIFIFSLYFCPRNAVSLILYILPIFFSIIIPKYLITFFSLNQLYF